MHNIFIEWLLFGLMRKKCVCVFFLIRIRNNTSKFLFCLQTNFDFCASDTFKI